MKRATRALRYLMGTAMIAGAGAVLAGGTSCASTPDETRFTLILQPDFNAYQANVDNYLRRRCGTLDCHGQPGRAYRIYGREGFRLYNEDAGLISGVLDARGEVRMCELREAVGNVRDTGYDFAKLWFSEGADAQRASIRAKECHCTHSCFMSSSLVFDWRTWGAYLQSTVVNFLSAA